ncbi:MAG: hypothetical protein QCI82_09975 [Candidatus Thermoplasmatota archaeon]|nr:hypothetical protein [Candidatus Thermoplasmatota archaeon]
MSIAVAVISLTALVSYLYIIPRTDMEVRTVYHEMPGGGGTGGVINVNVLLDNRGNRMADSIQCYVEVRDDEDRQMVARSITGISLGPGNIAELSASFIGSQYDDYRISVHLRFDSSGGTRIADLDYTTREDRMNLVFVERFG